ncbi:MAG: MopE-related protein [Vicinamibacterales bacterium]
MAPHRVVAVCLVIFVAGLLGASLPAEAQIPSPGGVIYACIRLDRDKDEGRLARLVAENEPCRRNEVRVQWNVIGPKGPTGPTGAQGPAGVKGATGLQGPPGPIGPQGVAGQAGAAGSAGPKGDKGDKGDPGTDGGQGSAGVSAPSGAIAGQLASCAPNTNFTGYLVHIPGRAFSAFTGPSGAFQIDNLPAGTYDLKVEYTGVSVSIPQVIVTDTLVTLPDPVQVGTCAPACVPTGAEVCDGIDNNCDGQVDEGNPGGGLACLTGQQGVCAEGASVCQAGLLTCAASNQPTAEVCGDGIDNNCNGQIDESCVCVAGSAASCYTGPAGSSGVGVCRAGTQVCNATGTAYGACTGQVVPGTEVCDGLDNNCNGVVDEDCTAALAVSRIGVGTVTSNPAGINCGATCVATFNIGAQVSLTPIAGAQFDFAGWSGACTGIGGCLVTMNAATSVAATFVQRSFDLTVTRAGSGAVLGFVSSNPSGINCGGTCSTSFLAGTTVNLSAVANPGSTFVGWSGGGGCSGTGTCLVVMNGASSVTANFTSP